jgi:hypothetical protein
MHIQGMTLKVASVVGLLVKQILEGKRHALERA